MSQLTWQEFKDRVESFGVQPDTKIEYIDIGFLADIKGVDVHFDKDHNELRVLD